MRRLLILLAATLALYLVGYAALRWRKVLVLHEASVKGERATICWIGPGRDVRENWRGMLRNAIAGPAAICYAPLGWIEVQVRGRTRRLP